ncbi:Clp protease N-terminal domain-containing protein [Streptomyces avicenniae]|uniref:Clp protease N-terminal domain-containing protein n=1 Tax=Streptomyces avicenniae TaxID=500153 RepID=UPI000699E341|nr:Clp protease N-terminal domain-containing protein [Streptomyces avicenniae]
MPKINVYLPDELAEAVKETGVPVSAVCQRALEQAVRRVTAIRESVLDGLDTAEPTGPLAHLTDRTRQVLKLAVDEAVRSGASKVGTEHLLAAMLAEGSNLALRVLRAMDVEPERVARELARRTPDAGGTAPTDGERRRFDAHAAGAIELTATEAIALGHNYIGCEHLLIGLASEPEGVAGQVLRELGAEPKAVRRAVTAALAGYVHLRAASQDSRPAATSVPEMLATAVRQEIAPLTARISRLETHLGLATADTSPAGD